MDKERLEELLEKEEERNNMDRQAIETLRRRFEPITYDGDDILRAARALGIPEELAREECISILTEQLKQASAAWKLPPRERLWQRFDSFMKKKQEENLE